MLMDVSLIHIRLQLLPVFGEYWWNFVRRWHVDGFSIHVRLQLLSATQDVTNRSSLKSSLPCIILIQQISREVCLPAWYSSTDRLLLFVSENYFRVLLYFYTHDFCSFGHVCTVE